jgi:hypothetical protein
MICPCNCVIEKPWMNPTINKILTFAISSNRGRADSVTEWLNYNKLPVQVGENASGATHSIGNPAVEVRDMSSERHTARMIIRKAK